MKRTLLLFLSGIVSIFASAGYLFGFIEEQLFQSFLQPSPMTLTGKKISQIVFSSFSNDLMRSSQEGTYNIGYTCIFILVIGVLFWKELNVRYKIIYVVGVFTFVMTTNLFPWSLMQKTPLAVIQFPFRLMIFSTLFACLTGANLIKILSENYKFKGKSIILTAVLFLCTLPWSLSVNAMLDRAARFDFDTETIYFSDPDNRFSMWIDQYTPEVSQQYAEDIYHHIGYIDGKKIVVPPRSEKQQTLFSVSTNTIQSKVDLPIIRYKNTVVTMDGTSVPTVSSHRGTVQLLVPKGTSTLIVTYAASPLIRIGLVFSGVTWLLLLSYLTREIIKKRKSKGNTTSIMSPD